MARPRFIRENRTGWGLAYSLGCPDCGNRLWGDKTFAWCKSYDCSFHCTWEDVLTNAQNFNKMAFYTEKLSGTITPSGVTGTYYVTEVRYHDGN